MAYVAFRSCMNVGAKVVGDAFHVEFRTPSEEQPVASFWISEKQSALLAKARAEKLAEEMNTTARWDTKKGDR